MAFSRLVGFLSFLSLALLTLGVPHDLERRAGSSQNVVKFEINLTWGDWNPVGAGPRKAIYTNGTIPGPPLRCQIGDIVEFMVHNNLPNSTTIHFHGITQFNTPWSDGVPGLSQKAIQPGKSFLYRWLADESGTYFYHAHLKSQIMDGLYGAIIIAPRDDAQRPWSFITNDTAEQAALTAAEAAQQPVFISDYSKYTSDQFHEFEKAANIDNSCSDSILINGKGSVFCLTRQELTAYTQPRLLPLLQAVSPSQITDKGCLPPNLPATQGNFTRNIDAVPADLYYTCKPSNGDTTVISADPSKKWVALTFTNVATFSVLKWTIDGHKMWVYAVDGQYVVPQLVSQVIINNGDRYQVLVKLDQKAAQYAIRVANQGLNQVISGFAVLEYKGSSAPASADPNALAAMNYAGTNLTAVIPFNDARASPFPPMAPALKADRTFIFNIRKMGRPYGAYEWTLSGNESYHLGLEDADPLLFKDPSTVPADNVTIKTNKGEWVDLIIKVAGPLAQPHAMHKHSNKAFVLGKGIGSFNFSSVAAAAAVMPNTTFNFNNPPYRDGYTTTPAEGNSSWMVLRYHVVNPGAFLFHCHMQTHLFGGMAITMLDGVDSWPRVPNAYLNGDGLNRPMIKKGKKKPKN